MGVGSLSSIDSRYGFWMKMNEAVGAISIPDYNNPEIEYNYHYGNNLTSFSCENPIAITAPLPDDIEVHITGIIGEGTAATQISPFVWVGSLSEFQPNEGYWVKVTQPIDFEFICGEEVLRAPTQDYQNTQKVMLVK